MANKISIIFSLSVIASYFLTTATGNFYQDVNITWGDGRGKILDRGNSLSLTLDKYSGSGFQSKRNYLFGRFDVQMKLASGNSAGTVTTFYLTSQGPHHDEIDLEFLGNLSGNPYTLHTNVFSQGGGHREQEFRLWFDPTKDFHTYSIIWNPQRIIFFVDNIPVRVFNNLESVGVPFPKKQPMRIEASFWDAENWATMGGSAKTDWSKAPFTAYYRNLNVQTTNSKGSESWLTQGLTARDRKLLTWVQKNHMIFNYCADPRRHGGPRECRASRF